MFTQRPWQMTRKAFYHSKGYTKTPSLGAEASHWYAIKCALKQGQQVPVEVMADYPKGIFEDVAPTKLPRDAKQITQEE